MHVNEYAYCACACACERGKLSETDSEREVKIAFIIAQKEVV